MLWYYNLIVGIKIKKKKKKYQLFYNGKIAQKNFSNPLF